MSARVAALRAGRRRGGCAAAAVYAQREFHAAAAAAAGAAKAAGATAARPSAKAAEASSCSSTSCSSTTGPHGGRQHFGTQSLAPRLRDRRGVYPVVGEHHDQQRHIERYGGREYQVTGAVSERARVPRHRFLAHQTPPHDGREADDAAAHPHGPDEPVRAFPAHLGRVRERVCDGPVPVQRDDAQVQYGRGAEQYVQRPPHVTRIYAERPVVVEHLVHRAHRHHHQAHQEVGERQRSDEVVGGRVQVPFAYHRNDHQTVAENRHHAEAHQHHGQRKPVAERRAPVFRLFCLQRRVVVVLNGERRGPVRRSVSTATTGRRPVHRDRSIFTTANLSLISSSLSSRSLFANSKTIAVSATTKTHVTSFHFYFVLTN